MTKPKLSMILAAYNEEKFIDKAICSLVNQSLKEMEIIIVNDGSTDKTLEIIEKYAKDDNRIKVIDQSNIGLGASRNKAMEIAQGEYVGFLDGDDWFRLDALETSYNEAKSKDTDMTMFQMINYDEETGRIYENDWFNLNNLDESFDDTVFSPERTKDFLFDLSVSSCQKIYKNSFLKSINASFPEGIYFEDMPFFFYVYLKAKRISIIRHHFYYRRKHNASITHVVDGNYLDTVEAGCELMRRFIDNGFYEDYKFDLIAYKINGPRMALMDITEDSKEPLFNLIKEDYEKIKKTEYYQDYLDNLGPKKKKFFLDVLKYDNYEEFREHNPEY
ncbi:MAG: glycosyltransferase family 2 protein [Methanobrevibacter sp.]|nr:glycosyltransferase family 2 protein [Methanobrevibacter sp.]